MLSTCQYVYLKAILRITQICMTKIENNKGPWKGLREETIRKLGFTEIRQSYLVDLQATSSESTPSAIFRKNIHRQHPSMVFLAQRHDSLGRRHQYS